MKSTHWLEVVPGTRAWWRPRLWHVRMIATNGQIVMSSETYFSKSNADRAACDLGKDLHLEVRDSKEQ